MKIYKSSTVYEESLRRMRWLFNEFKNISVSFSGGKDSTVTLNLALKVAEEQGRLPLPVMFIDQESEWECVIDYVRDIMYDDRVEPIWVQAPFKLFNAASSEWMQCWDPALEDQWIHPKDPISIQENTFDTESFADMFDNVLSKHFNGEEFANLGGVRAEESPARYVSLVNRSTYKHITWGKRIDVKKRQYTFYPLYDWSFSDIWKAIEDHSWQYCRLYDYMYQYGVSSRDMRVSSIIHETALTNLYFLSEIEPRTWEKISARVKGTNSVKTLEDDFIKVTEIPPMFYDAEEYRDHLLENLIQDPDIKEKFRSQFKACDRWILPAGRDRLMKLHVKMLLKNDYHGGPIGMFRSRPGNKPYILKSNSKRKGKK